ncbi:sodium:proline symporter, partial [Mesorhizobium sp. M2D.F.Ca.ET.185.01.1.1]
GAAFSPLVIFSLYWKGLSHAGALSGMITGALVVIVWIAWVKPLASVNEIFGMYEIIPGFLASVIVTYLVSKITKKPGEFVEHDLNKVKEIVKE